MIINLIRVLRDEEGATLVEYGLLVSLIAVVCIAVITAMGKNISTMFKSISTSL